MKDSIKKEKILDEFIGYSEKELLRELVYYTRETRNIAEKIKSNTTIMVWCLVITPIIVVALIIGLAETWT